MVSEPNVGDPTPGQPSPHPEVGANPSVQPTSPPPDQPQQDEPVEAGGPPYEAGADGSQIQVETAFLTAPTDSALEDQRERLRLLMDRGALVVLLVAAITFFAAVINSIRGNFEYTHWIFPVVAIGMGVGLYFGAERMANRPEHAIEVPADLSAVLNDLTIARGEVIATAPRVLNPDELQQVLTDAQERHKAAFAAASETLRAIRAGDIERASALGTEVYRHTDVIEQIRDDLQREWESSAEVPEGYIGDTDDDPPLGAPSPRSPMSRRAQAAEPAYPTSYPAEPIPPSRVGDVPPAAASGQPPPAEATRDFWSRPTSPPRGRAAGVYPRPEGGIGQSGSSTGPAE